MQHTARAFWLRAPGRGEIRTVPLPGPGVGDVMVRTLYSGISRGTETLVFRGEVPESQRTAMRAPFQEGDFPAPVKYGYLNVGVVEQGPPDLLGRTVFSLYPHQTRYVVPAGAVTVVPDTVPPARAVLAGTVETAVNALWDAAPLAGDRIAVVGAGMVGCCVAAVLSRYPAVRVQLVDTDPARAGIARAFGVGFAPPEEADAERDLVFHTSATEAGLARSLELLAPEGEVIELSWYGDRRISLPLGESFHSRRLTVRSSQVGAVSPARRSRRTFADRLALALELLADPAFDVLLTERCTFEELPRVMPGLAENSHPALCQLIEYPAADEVRTGGPNTPEGRAETGLHGG
ncbi:zinc-dependent alcohol dehydrogenase [Streptomyces sp. x-80]|uniref:zinc-dependent alcohol dehydrogenase n=1 Tax=Streptomyces sp. x-80 TaxID=2789282 RepID=UPI003980520E